MPAKKVFCSHRGVDKPQVEAFARRLREERAIDAWLDVWEIAAGDSVVASINRGLEEADVVLVFFSSATAGGVWVTAEIEAAIHQMIEEGQVVIPVMLDDDAYVPPLLKARARRGVEEFESIVAAIEGRTMKPRLGPAPEAGTLRRFVATLSQLHGQVRVSATLDGEPVAEPVASPLGADLAVSYAGFLRGWMAPGRRLDGPDGLQRELVSFGKRLGAVLLPGAIGERLAALLGGAAAGENVELVFETAEAGLLSLPFEAARLPDGTAPALHHSASVARRATAVPRRPVAALAGPLKILVAVGAPDEGQTRSAPLDMERELQTILDAVAPAARHGNAQVRFLEVGHPDEIGKALGEDAYHVLHLSGHGAPGKIELEDEEGRAVEVAPEELAAVIQRSGRPLPLVFLSSCHGGVAETDSTGFAHGLLAAGIPSVLAMQTQVTDGYATSLARAFYETLAHAEPPFAGRALAFARKLLEEQRRRAEAEGSSGTEVAPEYATASLFLAGPEEPIHDPSLDLVPLERPPVHRLTGPVPWLDVGYLIGRRPELRRVLRVLRNHEATVAELGARAGVAITGMGGVGKSALAGRAMARLQEQGWAVAAVNGALRVEELAQAVEDALGPQGDGLFHGAEDDGERLRRVATALQAEELLLVLDNFEDNLPTGGGEYLDPTVAAAVDLLLGAAGAGKVLITSRYPVPDGEDYLAEVPLGPLSKVQTHKLFLRLDALRGLDPGDVDDVIRHVGGHPRLLEFLDGILKGGAARLPEVRRKLRALAADAGVDLGAAPDDLQEAIRSAVLVGSRDIFVDELLALAEQAGDREVILQAAVSSLPVGAVDLASMLGGPESGVAAAAKRLVDLSLLTPLGDGKYVVHRWTAEALRDRSDPATYRERHRRAARFRLSLLEAQTATGADIVEAVDSLIEAEDYDEAVGIAVQIAAAMQGDQRSVDAAAFAGDVVERVPPDTVDYAPLADLEATALLSLGFTTRAMARYATLTERFERRAAAEPDRADYQRDLSVSYNKMGDLYRALGQGADAAAMYQASLDIRRRLTEAEPDRADYQRDLSVSYERMGDLYGALGQGQDAAAMYQASLDIWRDLTEAEPDRADYRRGIVVPYERMGDYYRALGQRQDAAAMYQASLDIWRDLTEAEPHRADYQRGIVVPLARLGDLAMASGAVREALAYHSTVQRAMERLTEAEPDRADYQRDLSISYNKMGDLYRALGQGPDAAAMYQASLDIARRLTEAEPDRADYQRDLSASHHRLATHHASEGESELAAEHFRADLDIAERLAAAEPERADYAIDLAISLAGAVQWADDPEPMQRRALAILEGLDADERLPADRQGMLERLRAELGG